MLLFLMRLSPLVALQLNLSGDEREIENLNNPSLTRVQ